MNALLLTALLFYFSCTKYAALERHAVGTNLTNVTMGISHLNEIDWNVGLRKEEKVTQSFTFFIEMPKIKPEDLDYLTQQKNVDAWILRLIVNRDSKTQDLGSLYSLFRPRKLSRAFGSGAASSVTMKVYYAAAFASERFRTFKCPAFGHTKKINKMSIIGENEPFSLLMGQAFPYNEKSQLVELTPSSFNGGNSLKGEYFVEIAPYDSKRKLIHSSFKRIPMSIIVEREESVPVRSCVGIHQEFQ